MISGRKRSEPNVVEGVSQKKRFARWISARLRLQAAETITGYAGSFPQGKKPVIRRAQRQQRFARPSGTIEISYSMQLSDSLLDARRARQHELA